MILLGLLVTTGWGAGQTARSWVEYVGIELLADGAAAVVFIISAVTVMRPRPGRSVRVPVVIIVWTLIGLVRALVLDRFYVEGVAQIVSATVTLAAWALLLIYVAATVSDERQRALQLSHAHAELLLVRESTATLLADERARLADAVRDSVTPEIARLRQLVTVLDRPANTHEISSLADTVAAYSTNVIRETSREIRAESGVARRVPIASASVVEPPTVLQAYARVSQPILIPMALITLRALTVWASQDDLAVAVAGLLGLGLVTALGWLLGRVIDLVLPRPSAVEMTASSVLVVTMAAVLMVAFDRARDGAAGPTYVPLPLILAFVLAVLLAARLVSALEWRWREQVGEWTRVNEELDIANQDLNAQVRIVRDQLAAVLHGPVQGRLAAASMALRMYVTSREAGKEADLAATVIMATTLLDRATADIEGLGRGGVVESGLAEGIDRIARNWSGLLALDVVLDDPWDRPEEFTRGCIDLVSELVTNASRHGDARRVAVSVVGIDAHRVRIEAIDDGVGPRMDAAEGQGLGGVRRWAGQWSIRPGADGGAQVCLDLCH